MLLLCWIMAGKQQSATVAFISRRCPPPPPPRFSLHLLLKSPMYSTMGLTIIL